MKLGEKTSAILLLAIALVLVNFLASQFPARIDLTESKIYTLSPGTISMLEKIEEPITLNFYFSRSLDALPIRFKNYATRVEEMLRQYVSKSNGMITLNVIDPKPDTDEETEARRAGVQPQTLSNGEMLFFGLSAFQVDQEKAIPFFSPNREPFLEYDISQLIHEVQQFDKPKLGLITGLPLQGNPMPMPGQRPEPDQYVIEQWKRNFEVLTIDENADELPSGVDVLAIIHPQNLGEKLLFAIDQFLLEGNPVLVVVDPSSYLMRSRQRQQGMMMGQPPMAVSSDLPRLFGAWGITYDASSVIGDLDLSTGVSTAQGIINFPVWLSLREDNFAADVLPTADLSSMLVVEPGSIEVAEDRGYEVTPLIQTGPRTGSVSSMLLTFTPPNELLRQIHPDGVPRTIAAMITGTFKTAFPNGAPKDPEEDEAKDESADEDSTGDETAAASTEETGPEPLKESARPGTLVVVADSDWLLDDFSMRRINFLGMQAIEPLNDNLAFAGNIVDFLGGSRDLISIRSKGVSQRPFTVIQKMEQEAQERYQEELESLEAKLSEVRQQISKLQNEQTEGRRLVATPEVQKAIEDYRLQEAEMRARIREIRRSLREGIESLENWLTVINLLSIPILVVAFGSVFLVNRTRHQRS
ncbi:MAG: ABC transporter [Verrucomicrobia bacterium]|nr:MAG: ABC transporter [Verrucomicrobiota bacterium]